MAYDDEPRYVPRRPERLILPGWALIAIGLGLVALVVGLGLFVAARIRRGREAADGVVALPTLAAEEVAPDVGGLPIWRGTERVTVLVMGVDERAAEQGPWRTDTLLLLSLDPATHTGSMLSIPRDLWVNISGAGEDRINTANVHGEVNGYPGGGPGLAMDTIAQNLGIAVDHYVMLNFASFVSFVDAIGCISLDVPESISDPTYPDANFGYDPFFITAGFHEQVCGEEALKYARTRVTFGGDFDRAARQQQVIYAVRDRLLEPGHATELLAQVPQVWSAVQGGVRTDLTPDEMIALAILSQDIPDDSIRSEVLDGRYTDAAITEDERYILTPKTEAINLLVRDLFPAPAEAGGPSLNGLAQQATQEQATLSILNGTATDGLGGLTASYLGRYGLGVEHIGESGRTDYLQTIIYDNTGKPGTTHFLASLLGVPESAIIVTGDTQARYDVQVVLGADVFGNDGR